ncbi:MAG: sigma 54-interacting transcriptional regulator [Planctomycetota bacterium]
MAIRFSIESGDVTRTYELRRSVVTFGRSGSSMVPIEDPALSRTHCQFEVEEGVCYVRDLNSRNGTYLQGERISRVAIKSGDVVVIGNARITFHGEAEGGLPTDGAKTAQWTAKLFATREVASVGATTDVDARRLRRLLKVVKSISQELEPERVLTRILDAAIEFVEAERGFLVLRDGAALRVPVARNFWKKDISTPALELSRSIALAVVRRGEPLVTDDASHDARFDEAASVFDLRIRSVLCVPLRAARRVIGAIYLDNRFSRGIFGHAELEAMQLFAEQAVLAVENSRHFDAVRESGEHWEQEAKKRRVEQEMLKAQLAQMERAEGLRFVYPELIGRSEAMVALLKMADRVAEVDLAVLLRGESGTGKELLARAIHANGVRQKQKMVTVDSGALSSSVGEAELFGNARGAFTGSHKSRAGLLETAHRGTLFLDGIDDMDIDLQKRLLRVLETGEFRRIGDTETRHLDVRVISACHGDLEEAMAAGRFREDLYYRLKGIEIEVPPLRERIEDLPVLLDTFLADTKSPRGHAATHSAAEASEPAAIKVDAAAMRQLCAYRWPGNVRELKNEADRLRLGGRRRIRVEDLSPEIAKARASESPVRPLRDEVDELELRLILRALDECDGNKTRAAEALGLSRLGLRKKMARLGVEG